MILRGIDRDEGISNVMLAREKWQVKTLQVLERVFEERCRQVAQYGHNEDLEDGFGPDVDWLPSTPDARGVAPFGDAVTIEQECRRDYEKHEARHGKPTWMHLIREEMAEFLAEPPESEEAIHEALQTAALLVSWAEKRI